MSALTNLLANNGCIIVNKVLIRKLGLECAILIGELCSKYSYWEKHNYKFVKKFRDKKFI